MIVPVGACIMFRFSALFDGEKYLIETREIVPIRRAQPFGKF